MKIVITYLLPVLLIMVLVFGAKAQANKNNWAFYTAQDNDVLRFSNPTDQFYSFGLFAGFSLTLDSLSDLNKLFLGHGLKFHQKRMIGTELALKGYTPEFLRNEKLEEIRPFAGTLTFAFNLSEAGKDKFFKYNLLLGVRGPASGAQWIQDRFHEFIGSPIFLGWENQLPNKFVYMVDFFYARQISISPLMQILPQGSLSLGNYRTQAEPGLMVKIGRSLELHESMLFRLPTKNKNKFTEFFITARLFGRLIFSDTTLPSNTNLINQLTDLDKARKQAGYDVRINARFNQIGIFFSRQRHSKDSNFSGAHSYGSLGLIIG